MKCLAVLCWIVALAITSWSSVGAVSPERAWTRHADTFLIFPTFYSGWDSEDSAACLGASHALHPSVVFAPNGFLGYRLWVAYTPICISESDENPHIAVSNDGRTWIEYSHGPDILHNPVFDRFAAHATHLADPDLLLLGDTALCMVFRATWEVAGVDSNAVFASVTTDGLHWSAPVTILSDRLLGNTRRSALISPSITADPAGGFSLFAVEPRAAGLSPIDTTRVVRYQSSDPLTPFELADTCTFRLPSDTLKIWHLEILPDIGFGAFALVNLVVDSPSNTGDSADLYLAAFDPHTGVWAVAPTPLLSWMADPAAWYGRRIYRASAFWTPTATDTVLWLYYSAYAHRTNIGGTGTGWQTGLTWVTSDTLLGPEIFSPTLRNEPNLQHVCDPNPALQWLFADPTGHRVQEDAAIEVRMAGDDPSQPAVWSGEVCGEACETPLDDLVLEPGRQYTLRLRSRSGLDWSAWTEMAFQTNFSPSSPACVSPADYAGTPIYDLRPLFTWAPSVDPDNDSLGYYRIRLTAGSPAQQAYEMSSGEPAACFDDSLLVNQPYYWEVAGCDVFGACSGFSNPMSFVTYLPGDLTADGAVSITDLTRLVGILFRGSEWTTPHVAGDIDSRCGVSVGDLAVLVHYLFRNGSPPSAGCRP